MAGVSLSEGDVVTGRIIRSTGSWYRVAVLDSSVRSAASESSESSDISESSESSDISESSDNPVNPVVLDCRLPGKFRLDDKEVTNPIAVGDLVTLRVTGDGSGSIAEIHERRNYIPRKATHGRRGDQILVANVDMAWVVQSVRQPRFREGFIDRFLVMCEAYQIPVGILINKTDLAKKNDLRYLEELKELYEGLGYPFLPISAETGEGVERFNRELHGRTSVLIGPSGTGKTSLLNAVQPELELRTGEVSSYSGKGKHTTTFAELLPIFEDSFVVDTPGVREFGLVDIEPYELSLFFPEMREPREHCRFYNCTHIHEPGCGVMEAWESGEIAASRYASYMKMMEEVEEAD